MSALVKSFIADQYSRIASFTEKNILTTPFRKKAACVGVALTAHAIGSFYLGFPHMPEEYRRNMGMACGRQFALLVQQFPENYQFLNVTRALEIFSTDDSCLLRVSQCVGRMVLNGIVSYAIPVRAFGKMFAIHNEEVKQAENKKTV